MAARLNAGERPLRVLMTADAVGGVWRYAVDLAEGLAGFGVETTIAVFGPGPSEHQIEAARNVPGLRTVLLGGDTDWMRPDDASMAEAGAALQKLAKAGKADLVHLNAPAFGAFADFRVPVVAGCHSCLATWWAAVKKGPPPKEFAWRTGHTARGYAKADMLIAPSHAFAGATAKTYRLSRSPTVVWNGRRAMRLRPAGPPEDFALTVGRLWDQGKNVRLMDAAAGRMSRPVYAAGQVQGPHGERISLRHARPLGTVGEAELRARLRTRPVFVSPALYEPFGLAVLEAAQAGCALVLSDVPTFRELWDGAAVFVPTDADEAVLAEAVEAVFDEPDRRAELGRAAKARSARFTVGAMTEGTFDAYRTVLDVPAAGEAAA